jgi:hypothetical protein
MLGPLTTKKGDAQLLSSQQILWLETKIAQHGSENEGSMQALRVIQADDKSGPQIEEPSRVHIGLFYGGSSLGQRA